MVDLAIKREAYMAKQALKGDDSQSLEDSDDDDNKLEVLEIQ